MEIRNGLCIYFVFYLTVVTRADQTVAANSSNNNNSNHNNDTTPVNSIPFSITEPSNAIWILICAYLVFTMQTGFALLEAGCVSVNNQANAFYKSIADVVVGGTAYWLFGYAFAFGSSSSSNGFIGVGDFALNVADHNKTGDVFVNFVFQASFASAGTTIVSGAVAERCKLMVYIIYCFTFVVTYSVTSHWMWAPNGWLKVMGALDGAGSGVVHLCGGTAALVAAATLGPRKGRFTPRVDPPPASNSGYIVLGTFFLWWGWLGFNSGSSLGMTGGLTTVAARAATTSLVASFSGGMSGTCISMVIQRGKVFDVGELCNAILGALVSCTASCMVIEPWHACIIGLVGGVIPVLGVRLVALVKVDDPVGAVSVHFMCGLWGLLAVGLFTIKDEQTLMNGSYYGAFNGGGGYLLGMQALAALCIFAWSAATTLVLFLPLRWTVGIRLSDDEQEEGADKAEHKSECVFVTHEQLEAAIHRHVIAMTSNSLTSTASKLQERPQPSSESNSNYALPRNHDALMISDVSVTQL